MPFLIRDRMKVTAAQLPPGHLLNARSVTADGTANAYDGAEAGSRRSGAASVDQVRGHRARRRRSCGLSPRGGESAGRSGWGVRPGRSTLANSRPRLGRGNRDGVMAGRRNPIVLP